ncbi:MAG: HAD family phosphatase [Spirochaetaceae bacterium]|nr:HAD family phosphatase [Spirochaetaceae bacterium]
MIKAVIFDMDGVILDSESVCDKTWEAALAEEGFVDDKDAINKCRGTNYADTCKILHELYGSDFPAEKFMARGSELFHQIENEQGIPLLPYAKEVLEYLSAKYIMALASSTREASVRRLLKDKDVLGYFKTLTTGDMVSHSKPDPEIYRLACASIGLPPEVCVAVEDSPNGIKSAYTAGLKVVMVPDRIAPTKEIEKLCWQICPNLYELEKIL